MIYEYKKYINSIRSSQRIIYHKCFVDVVLSDIGGVSSIAPTSVGSSDAIGAASDEANANRLQRQKAGSRKTFKFRKTRKDVSMKLCLTHFYFILPFDTPIKPRIV